MNALSQHLRMAFHVEGVLATLMISRDGLLIEGYANDEIDLDAMAAMVSRGVDHCESLSSEFYAKRMDWMMLRGEGRSIWIKELTDDVFWVLLVEEGDWLKRLDGWVDEWVPMAGELKESVSRSMETLAGPQGWTIGDENG